MPYSVGVCPLVHSRRACLRPFTGDTAIADRKLEHGSLLVLGMVVSPKVDGVRFVLGEDKAAKYGAVIREALETGCLSGGASIKLAGKLMWATQHLFNRVGRAVIKPLFAHKRSRCRTAGLGEAHIAHMFLFVAGTAKLVHC